MHQTFPSDKNIHMQGSLSQNLDLGFCYFFMMWNVKNSQREIPYFEVGPAAATGPDGTPS